MNMLERAHNHLHEDRTLKEYFKSFAKKVAQLRGEGVPGNNYRGWDIFEGWDYDYVEDLRAHIVTYWEYADCGSEPYAFPAVWCEYDDEELKLAVIQQELDAKALRKAAEKEELIKIEEQTRKDQYQEYLRLRAMFEGVDEDD